MVPFDLTRPPFDRCVRYLTHAAAAEEDGAEVQPLLRRSLGISSGWIKHVKRLPDGIALDGRRVTTRDRVRAGQTLRLRLSDSVRRSGIESAPGPLHIVYEDEDLLVLNKPAGVPVHPSPHQNLNTIGNFLLYYYDFQGIPADFHPVHRLDRGTSGLMIAAKHPCAQERLRRAFHTDAFRREYLAVCDAVPAPRRGVVDLPLSRAPDSILRREVSAAGSPARTEYEVLAEGSGRCLVRLHLLTGRTHQIRVHMAALGCPLTGDFLYGRENPALIRRPALHSCFLAFSQPFTGVPLSFALPLPADMAALL